MFMQYMDIKTLSGIPESSPTDDIVSYMFQLMMSLRALYKVKLVHGDINVQNIGGTTFDKKLRSVSKYLLYFIDYGMGFIKGILDVIC